MKTDSSHRHHDGVSAPGASSSWQDSSIPGSFSLFLGLGLGLLDSSFGSPLKACFVRKTIPCCFDFYRRPQPKLASRHSQTPDYPSHKFSSGCPYQATAAAIVEGSRSHGRTSRLPTRGAADSAHQGSEGPASDEDNAAYLKVSHFLFYFPTYSQQRRGSFLEGRPLSFSDCCGAPHHE